MFPGENYKYGFDEKETTLNSNLKLCKKLIQLFVEYHNFFIALIRNRLWNEKKITLNLKQVQAFIQYSNSWNMMYYYK